MSVFQDERPGELLTPARPPVSEQEQQADLMLRLYGTLAELEQSVRHLAQSTMRGPAREPFRDSGVSNGLRLVRSGACELVWIHAANELGSADAYLQLFDEFNPDSPKLGDTKPRLTLRLGAGADRDRDLRIVFRRGIVIAATSTRDGSAAPDQTILVDLTTVPLR